MNIFARCTQSRSTVIGLRNVTCNWHPFFLFFATSNVSAISDRSENSKIVTPSALRADRRRGDGGCRFLFACLLFVPGGFVAASVRYLTLFSRSRAFSLNRRSSPSSSSFFSHSIIRSVPFYLSLFVSSLRNRSVQIYTPVVRWSDVGNFHCLSILSSTITDTITMSLSLLPPFSCSRRRRSPRGDTASPPARTKRNACPPIVLSDLLLQDRG